MAVLQNGDSQFVNEPGHNFAWVYNVKFAVILLAGEARMYISRYVQINFFDRARK